MLGNSPPGEFTLGGPDVPVVVVPPIVHLLAERTADLITAGHTAAEFERPAVSATFERADALVIA